MKKMIAILLSVLTVLCMCACSKGEPRTETKTDDYTPDYGELYYASGDTKFGIMDPAEEVLNALGEPVNGTFESDSCNHRSYPRCSALRPSPHCRKSRHSPKGVKNSLVHQILTMFE